jgi:hypothetical protein
MVNELIDHWKKRKASMVFWEGWNQMLFALRNETVAPYVVSMEVTGLSSISVVRFNECLTTLLEFGEWLKWVHIDPDICLNMLEYDQKEVQSSV